MAIYYVYSGAGGSNNGSSWANAFTTLTAAFVTEAAGDTLYVAHDHVESTAGIVTLSSSGSLASPTKVVCVNRAGTVPPVSADRRATAQVITTGANNITLNGWTHYDGIIFLCGSGTTLAANLVLLTASNNWLRFDNCSLRLGVTGAGASTIYIGGSSGPLTGTYIELNNTTMSFGGVNNTVSIVGMARWRDTPSALLGTIPSLLFVGFSARSGSLDCIGVDLSAAGSGKTLVNSAANTQAFRYNFTDCKLDASVTKASTPVVAFGSVDINFVRCSTSGNSQIYSEKICGSLVEELTIVRSGGASDGTTPIAWKIVTPSTPCYYSVPFECPPIAIWNDTTGASVTATIEGVWGGGAVPLDDEIWVEVEYLGDASSPQGSFVNDGKANLLATAANQAASSESWGGSTTKFKLAVSFTPQQKGWVYARVKVAKASSTFYIDPLVTLT